MGDMSHLASFFLIFYKIQESKSVAGISLKSQLLYLLVFVARYIDLMWNFSSLYNWCMKVLFIGSSGAIVYAMLKLKPHSSTYDATKDSQYPMYYIIVPCALLGCLWHESDAD